MTDEKRREPTDPFREGVRAITGILGALKDAIEETFDELRQQGDLSPERAREAARSTVRKAQEAVEDVRERLDFVPRRELNDVRAELAELRRRVEALEQAGGATAGGDTPSGGNEGGPDFPVDGA